MCGPPDVRATFDRLATEYDELKLRVIPGYRRVQDLAIRYASAHPRERVLELGCGTGEWASAFLQNHPAAQYVAIESSPKMRERASTRLASHGTRFRLLDRDLNGSLPVGPFDLIVSFFAIHHVHNKQRLVENVFASLASGGLFMYADITVAPDPVLEQSFLRNVSHLALPSPCSNTLGRPIAAACCSARWICPTTSRTPDCPVRFALPGAHVSSRSTAASSSGTRRCPIADP